MTEEQVTKAMLRWLLSNHWTIVSFDYPQSGTGKILHPNGRNEEKNKDSIIPDIIAVRNGICIFSENKDRFYYPDFEKQNRLMKNNDYSEAITTLLAPYSVESIYYGIGIPIGKYRKIAQDAAHLVHFILCVNEDKTIQAVYNPHGISFVSME